MAARRFVNKPVEVEAIQWDGSITSADEIEAWSGGNTSAQLLPLMNAFVLVVQTKEGEMTATSGDWIIRGIKGGYYPCKSDMFETTFREVTKEVNKIMNDQARDAMIRANFIYIGFGVAVQFDKDAVPEINWDHIDGPLLYMRSGKIHWLTLWERFRCWLGLDDAFTLERKYDAEFVDKWLERAKFEGKYK